MERPLGFRKAATTGVAGRITLAVESGGDRTRPVRTESTGVLRLMQPLYLDDSGQVTYIMMNPGGAYFGEKYRVAVEVGPHASLLLTSQGATRIYRTPNKPAVHETVVTLHAGSRIEYVPDQVIAYRSASYRQRAKIVTSPDAQAFWGEIVTPGWDPNDEKFTFTSMHMRTEVCCIHSDGCVLIDNLRLEPHATDHSIHDVGFMEGYSHLGSALILGQHTKKDNYVATVRGIVMEYDSVNVGVSAGERHGMPWVIVRALGNSTDDLRRIMLHINEFDRSATTGQSRLDLRRY